MEGHKFSVSLWKDNRKSVQRVDHHRVVLPVLKKLLKLKIARKVSKVKVYWQQKIMLFSIWIFPYFFWVIKLTCTREFLDWWKGENLINAWHLLAKSKWILGWEISARSGFGEICMLKTPRYITLRLKWIYFIMNNS